jgi:hypothetical protein
MAFLRNIVLLNSSDSERLLELTVVILRIGHHPRGSDGIANLIEGSGAETGLVVVDAIETELVRNTHGAHE